MKRTVIYSGITLVAITAVILVWHFASSRKSDQEGGIKQDVTSASPWTWKNPYTFKQARIPADWKKVNNKHLRDAVLALQHTSGKCLIYLTYDESVNHLSLPEYIEAVKPMNLKEYGINEFKAEQDKGGGEYYRGEGAKNLGDSIVNVDIRIWSDGADGFWESVVLADTEYKTLEYDAGDLVETLSGTTRE